LSHITQETPRETIARCQKHGADWIGDKIEFRYRDVDAPRAVVKEVFAKHMLADFVDSDPRVTTVLKDESKRGNTRRTLNYVTRPFVSPNPDTPIAMQIAKVDGSDESGDDFECLARVRIGNRQHPVTGESVPFALARPPEGQTEFTDSIARDRALEIANAVNHRLNHMNTGDVGAATRKALESLGAVKSLGGGNNYWISAAIGERAHRFLEELCRELGAYYLRAPITTLGAPHAKVAMAQAVESSLEAELKTMEAALEAAAHDAANPTLTKKGKARKKVATYQHKIDTLQGVAAKMKLYEAVVEARITDRLSGIRGKLEEQFNVLLNGGTVTVEKAEAAPPSSDAEPAPVTDRSPVSGETLAAAASDSSDPYAW
jgi:hypothetical protein